MEKVKQYCEYHHQFPSPSSDQKKDERRTDDIIPWDKEFCSGLDQPTLFELILVRLFHGPFLANCPRIFRRSAVH